MNGISIMQMIIAFFTTAAYLNKTRQYEYRIMGESEHMVPMSILVPAYNEELNVVDNIKSLLNLDYLNYEIIIINDGSKDNTLQIIIDTFDLHIIDYPVRQQIPTKPVRGIYHNPETPLLWVIDKENGGKSDALNAGMNLSRYPYFICVDADSCLVSDSLFRIAMTIIKNKHTVAVGGIIGIINGCEVKDGIILKKGVPKNIWAKFQMVEYFRSFLVGRIGWNHFNSLLIISGAFGVFQKEAVMQVGGYTTGSIGEDMDLVVKLHRLMLDKKYNYKLSFLPEPVCWTQAPEDLNTLYRQRRRWQIGLLDVLDRKRDMIMNPKYKAVGCLSMPYQYLFEFVSPIVEITGYFMVPLAYYFRVISFEFFLLFFIASVLFGIITSIGSMVVEDFTTDNNIRIRDLLYLSLLCFLENFSYRQMTVGFRLAGIFARRKSKHSWGNMVRKKFNYDLRREKPLRRSSDPLEPPKSE